MQSLLSFALLLIVSGYLFSQSAAQRIYETERAFERMAVEKGLNTAFIEFMAPDGILLAPEAENARENWRSRPPSAAFFTRDPILIDVASNEALGYSIGSFVFRPNGKSDTNALAGHYLSVWVRRPDGQYQAVFDAGINHATPPGNRTEWRAVASSTTETNEKKIAASDSSTGFYEMATDDPLKAYRSYLAEDAVLMREGMVPFWGKSVALKHLGSERRRLAFAKRKSFLEAADLAYVHSGYSIADKNGAEVERGNFVQVWKLRKGRWLIVADLQVPTTKAVR